MMTSSLVTREKPLLFQAQLLEQALLKAYIIPKNTKINKDGTLIELGQEILIQGKFPHIHINGHYDGFDFDFDIDITSHVSWFIKHQSMIILVYWQSLKAF